MHAHTVTTRPTLGALLMLVAASTLVARPAHAHAALQEISIRNSSRVNVDSTVERLVKELELNRKKEMELVRQLSSLRDSSNRMFRIDSGAPRRVVVQLRDASREIFRTQAQLMSLCERGAAGGGYIGVTFENDGMLLRNEDGRSGATSMQFSSYPKIVDIEPGSPAEKAGVMRGDSIMEFGTTDVVKGIVRFDVLLKPGNKLPMVVRRGGENKAIQLVVAKRPNDAPEACSSVDRAISAAMQPMIVTLPDRFDVMLPRIARAPRAPAATPAPAAAEAPLPPGAPTMFTFSYSSGDFLAGAELRRLTTDLAELTGTDDGVFVVGVARGSPAEQSGLKGGDVIVRANEMPVVRPDQVARALRDSDEGSVKLVVVRKRQKQTLTIKLK
jgi:hypothetical protein